jgi:hypothetical protein
MKSLAYIVAIALCSTGCGWQKEAEHPSDASQFDSTSAIEAVAEFTGFLSRINGGSDQLYLTFLISDELHAATSETERIRIPGYISQLLFTIVEPEEYKGKIVTAHICEPFFKPDRFTYLTERYRRGELYLITIPRWYASEVVGTLLRKTACETLIEALNPKLDRELRANGIISSGTKVTDSVTSRLRQAKSMKGGCYRKVNDD